MRKKILMIGETETLSGVAVDIDDFYSFFTSPVGGNWHDNEIEFLENPSRRRLIRKIVEVEKANYDYVIVIFSGHGIEVDNEVVLFLNKEGEEIELSDLTNLSQRQLIIADCCRKSFTLLPTDLVSMLTETTILSMSRDQIRQAYEDRILDSMPQEVVLYACDEDESAWGTSEGGNYLQYLLHATQRALTDSDSPFVNISRAHYKAASLLRQEKAYLDQHPQILQPRCSPHQRLPWAVNVRFL